MASITATPLPALGIVKLIIDWSPSQDSDLVDVYRITPDGIRVLVIGSPVRLSDGQAIVYDTNAPFDVALTYEAVITNPVVSTDDFARTTSPGWGSDEMGNAYTTSGGVPTGYSTNGFHGNIQLDAVNEGRAVTLPMTVADGLIEATMSVPTVATGAPILAAIGGRRTDSNNFYSLRLLFQTNSTVVLDVERRVGGIVTSLGAVTLPGTYVPFSWYRAEFEFIGTRLRGRAWTGTSTKPNWQIEVYDTGLNTGVPFYRPSLPAGNTNTLPISMPYDLTRVTSFAPATLTTAATVELDSDPHGWIRDPQEPARSIRLDDCGTHTFDCLTADRFVFFQGLDEEAYASSTGVFGVLDAEDPLTVAQTRKGISTAIRFVSTSLSDIPAIRRLFSTGRDLVLSLPTKYGWGIETYGTDAVTFHDVTASRLNRRDQRKPQRLWSAPIRVVDAESTYPTGGGGSNAIPAPGATYGDMTALGVPYYDLINSATGYPMVTDFAVTRTVPAGGWGTPEVGPGPWAVESGTATDFSVSTGSGRVAMSSRTTRRIIVVGNVEADHTGLGIVTVPVTATGGNIAIFLVSRFADTNNYILCGGFVESTGVVNAAILYRAGGVDNFVGGLVNTGITHAAGNTYTIKFEMNGSTVSSKLWLTSGTEPGSYLNTGTVPNPAVPGRVGAATYLAGTNTNTLPVSTAFDFVTFQHEDRTYLDWSQGVFL